MPLRAAAAVTAGLRLDIEFSDGHVGAVAEAPHAAPPPPPKPRRRATDDPGQGSLFERS